MVVEDGGPGDRDGAGGARWWLGAIPYVIAYAVSFALLTFSSAHRWGIWGVAIAAVTLAVTSILWHGKLRRRPASSPIERRWRLAVPWLMVGVGLGLVASRFLGWTEAVGFVGICLAFLGIGQLLIEWRSPESRPLVWGRRVVGLCAAGFLIGLAGISVRYSVWAVALMAIGVIISPIGLSLVSGGRLRLLDRDGQILCPRRRLLLAGVAAVAAGIWLFVLLGLDTRYAVLVGALLLLLVGAIASNTPADVLIVVAAVALVWAGLPRGVPPSEAVLPEQGETVMVALGDSYMSGEGATRFYNGTNHKGENECRRAPTAYAPLVISEASDAIPDDLAFLACSGAKGIHIYQQPQHPGEPVDAPVQTLPDGTRRRGLDQLRHLDWLRQINKDFEIQLVTVSVGGNEALFGQIGMSCIAPGDCSEIGGQWLQNLNHVRNSLDQTYQEIRNHLGRDVPVVVVPYPIPLNQLGCSWSLLTPNEHRFIYGFVGELNKVLADAAAEAGLHYLGAMAQTLEKEGLRICDRKAGEVGVNFFGTNPVEGRLDENVNPRNWFHNSLHPNQRGHQAMGRTLTQWLAQRPGVTANRRDPRPSEEDGPPTIASVEQIMNSSDFRHCGSSGSKPRYCGTVNDWVVGQVAELLWRSLLPLGLVITGAWLLWLQLIRGWRGWREGGQPGGQAGRGGPSTPTGVRDLAGQGRLGDGLRRSAGQGGHQ
jgi:lysophospholipase L1-like esterase